MAYTPQTDDDALYLRLCISEQATLDAPYGEPYDKDRVLGDHRACLQIINDPDVSRADNKRREARGRLAAMSTEVRAHIEACEEREDQQLQAASAELMKAREKGYAEKDSTQWLERRIRKMQIDLENKRTIDPRLLTLDPDHVDMADRINADIAIPDCDRTLRSESPQIESGPPDRVDTPHPSFATPGTSAQRSGDITRHFTSAPSAESVAISPPQSCGPESIFPSGQYHGVEIAPPRDQRPIPVREPRERARERSTEPVEQALLFGSGLRVANPNPPEDEILQSWAPEPTADDPQMFAEALTLALGGLEAPLQTQCVRPEVQALPQTGEKRFGGYVWVTGRGWEKTGSLVQRTHII